MTMTHNPNACEAMPPASSCWPPGPTAAVVCGPARPARALFRRLRCHSQRKRMYGKPSHAATGLPALPGLAIRACGLAARTATGTADLLEPGNNSEPHPGTISDGKNSTEAGIASSRINGVSFGDTQRLFQVSQRMHSSQGCERQCVVF